jgi:putative membrane protein
MPNCRRASRINLLEWAHLHCRAAAMLDLVLAIVHHLVVFGIAAVLAAELALMRPGAMSPQTVRLLGRFDAFYGGLALAILVVGFARVWFGAKGADFYLHNPVFWAKIGAFGIVGLISIKPTMRILAWQKLAQQDAAFVPPAPEIGALRRMLLAEIHVFALVPVFAAIMARGIGY